MNQSYAELNGRKLELVMGIGLQWRKTSHARQIYRYISAADISAHRIGARKRGRCTHLSMVNMRNGCSIPQHSQ